MNEASPVLPVKRAALGGKLRFEVEPLAAEVPADERIWAVNLLNPRPKWLYELYTLLAYPSVRAVDGRPLFKGVLAESLAGDADRQRRVLMIVTFACPDDFLAMATQRRFLAVSPLREMSAKNFVFGFTRSVGQTPVPSAIPRFGGDRDVYLVHHGRECGDPRVPDATAIRRHVDAVGGSLVFAGTPRSRLVVRDKAGKPIHRPRPLFFDHLWLYRFPDAGTARDFWASNAYAAVRTALEKETAALYERQL